MNKPILFAIILLFSFCDSRETVPREFLQPAEMSEVLVDFSLVEGMMRTEFIIGDSAKKVAPYLYDQVFTKHSISRQEFDKNMEYYLLHPDKLDPVYVKVLESLSKMESDLK